MEILFQFHSFQVSSKRQLVKHWQKKSTPGPWRREPGGGIGSRSSLMVQSMLENTDKHSISWFCLVRITNPLFLDAPEGKLPCSRRWGPTHCQWRGGGTNPRGDEGEMPPPQLGWWEGRRGSVPTQACRWGPLRPLWCWTLRQNRKTETQTKEKNN